jgi:hypothetical protein
MEVNYGGSVDNSTYVDPSLAFSKVASPMEPASSRCTDMLVCQFGHIDQVIVVPWASTLLNLFEIMGTTLHTSLIAHLYVPKM